MTILGEIPRGLLGFENPLSGLDSGTQLTLFASAITLALVGYMEVHSITAAGACRQLCTLGRQGISGWACIRWLAVRCVLSCRIEAGLHGLEVVSHCVDLLCGVWCVVVP